MKEIVVDANILMSAVLGKRVNELLEMYKHDVLFFTASICFQDAERHLRAIVEKRKKHPQFYLKSVGDLRRLIRPFPPSYYDKYEAEARRRIGARDMDGWPLVALALTLDCPIWTEDNDFFGTGIATWNTGNVELYLSADS